MSTAHTETDKIAEAAYFLWLDEGQPEGQEQELWFRAAEALRFAGNAVDEPEAGVAATPVDTQIKANPTTSTFPLRTKTGVSADAPKPDEAPKRRGWMSKLFKRASATRT